MIKYKEVASLMQLEYFRLLKCVSVEKLKNTQLKQTSKQSRFWHFFFVMVSQLSGEALKGTYYSLAEVIQPDNLEGKVKSAIDSFIIHLRKLEFIQLTTVGTLSISTSIRNNYINKSSEYTKSRLSYIKDLKSLKIIILDQIERLGDSLKRTLEENENLADILQKKEKAIIDFTAEYEATQEKLKEAQVLIRKGKIELLCKHCNMNYFDEDNFN